MTGDGLTEQRIDFEGLVARIHTDISNMLRMNIYEDVLGRKEAAARIRRRQELRRALRCCTGGDRRAKQYIKEVMKELLVKEYHMSEEWAGELLPAEKEEILNASEKFTVILYLYRLKYQEEAFMMFLEECGVLEGVREGERYEINSAAVNLLYHRISPVSLSFPDKLEILAQKIYERLKGNGIADELLEMKIDGISAGVSGFLPDGGENLQDTYMDIMQNGSNMHSDSMAEGYGMEQFNSIWVMYRGVSLQLSFMGFGSEKELRRVCRNICRYHQMGQLSERQGYMVTELRDGSRVAVARPPFSEGWIFFIRRFRCAREADLDQLVIGEGAELVRKLLKWLIRGRFQIAVTGEQGAGKTTLLAALVRYLTPGANIRVQETAFELHLRRLYPERNIVSFRQTETIGAQEALEFQKKTDGSVSILGEVASLKTAAYLVQTAQTAADCTLFTHHASSAADLTAYLRNALLMEGGFREERIAAEQAIRCVQFDIHLAKDSDGYRYIERITELIAGVGKDRYYMEDMLQTHDIIKMEYGRYVRGRKPERANRERMRRYLSAQQRLEFDREMEQW